MLASRFKCFDDGQTQAIAAACHCNNSHLRHLEIDDFGNKIILDRTSSVSYKNSVKRKS